MIEFYLLGLLLSFIGIGGSTWMDPKTFNFNILEVAFLSSFSWISLVGWLIFTFLFLIKWVVVSQYELYKEDSPKRSLKINV